ncbi:MAG TPA: APC family permease [Allosphingosinicella sp.]|jgi:amino acid transporter
MAEQDMTREAQPPAFTRSLSGLGVIILTMSVLSPGVSVLVSGGSILSQAGTGTVLAFGIGSLVCYCQTAMAAELGAAYPTAGYDYAAIGHAVGDWAGATTYIASICSIPLFLNTSAIGIALYLQPFGIPLSDNAITWITMAVIAALSMLNIRSNEYITGVFMLIEGAALLLIFGIGAWHIQPGAAAAMLHPMHVESGAWLPVGIALTGIAVNNASWALAGASQALMFSEDMKQPRTIGRIIMLAFALTVVLETAPMFGVIAGSHDLGAVLAAKSPFETFLTQYLPAFGLKMVSLAIAITIFNACLAGTIGIGRNVFSMGRTNLFWWPINRAVMQLIPKTNAPWVAIALICITTGLATYIPLDRKVLLLSGNYTILTIFYVWGVLAGRRSGRTGREESYRSPAFPIIPLIGILIVCGEIVVLWLDPESGRKSLFICSGIYALAWCYYRFVLMRRRDGWTMRGPEDIDAATAARAAQDQC